MNSFKFNSTIGTVARIAIAESLGIPWKEVYKVVNNLNHGRNAIMTKDGREYRLVLKEVTKLHIPELSEAEKAKVIAFENMIEQKMIFGEQDNKKGGI